MNNDEQFYEKISKSIIVELVKKNVIPLFLNKNSKRAVFTALFFY